MLLWYEGVHYNFDSTDMYSEFKLTSLQGNDIYNIYY